MAANVPRRLYRSRTDRRVAGVCGGLAEYFQLDPTLVRIATIVLALFTGGAVAIGYVIAMFVVPEEDAGP